MNRATTPRLIPSVGAQAPGRPTRSPLANAGNARPGQRPRLGAEGRTVNATADGRTIRRYCTPLKRGQYASGHPFRSGSGSTNRPSVRQPERSTALAVRTDMARYLHRTRFALGKDLGVASHTNTTEAKSDGRDEPTRLRHLARLLQTPRAHHERPHPLPHQARAESTVSVPLRLHGMTTTAGDGDTLENGNQGERHPTVQLAPKIWPWLGGSQPGSPPLRREGASQRARRTDGSPSGRSAAKSRPAESFHRTACRSKGATRTMGARKRTARSTVVGWSSASETCPPRSCRSTMRGARHCAPQTGA